MRSTTRARSEKEWERSLKSNYGKGRSMWLNAVIVHTLTSPNEHSCERSRIIKEVVRTLRFGHLLERRTPLRRPKLFPSTCCPEHALITLEGASCDERDLVQLGPCRVADARRHRSWRSTLAPSVV